MSHMGHGVINIVVNFASADRTLREQGNLQPVIQMSGLHWTALFVFVLYHAA